MGRPHAFDQAAFDAFLADLLPDVDDPATVADFEDALREVRLYLDATDLSDEKKTQFGVGTVLRALEMFGQDERADVKRRLSAAFGIEIELFH